MTTERDTHAKIDTFVLQYGKNRENVSKVDTDQLKVRVKGDLS